MRVALEGIAVDGVACVVVELREDSAWSDEIEGYDLPVVRAGLGSAITSALGGLSRFARSDIRANVIEQLRQTAGIAVADYVLQSVTE